MTEVTLGQHVLPLTPVSIPRARRGVTRAVDAFGGSFSDLGNGDVLAKLAGAGERVLYDLLCALIPGLKARMPFYEFAGFPTEAAYDADDFDEDVAETVAPSSAQVQEALAGAWEVSRIGRLISPVSTVVDPQILRAVVTGLLEDGAKAASTIMSQSSSSESALTNGSSTVAKGSRSNGSTGSSKVAAKR